jgi:hypothetical protein
MQARRILSPTWEFTKSSSSSTCSEL